MIQYSHVISLTLCHKVDISVDLSSHWFPQRTNL